MSICCRNAWDENIIMNEDIFRELQFWYFHCNFLSFKSIVPMYRQPQRVIFTDASQFAGAGFTVGDNTIVHFMWEKQDRDKSSTWRELKTVANNIQSLKNDLSGTFVKIYTDNKNVVSIVNKGSMNPELQDITLHILHMCISNNIVLEMEWIPRDDNSYVDYLSKLFVFDDWGVCKNVFDYFNLLWGPYTCDRFADNNNRKVTLFDPKYSTPESSGVDAFAYDWFGHNNWLVPPIHLVSRCLIHMQLCKAKGTLVMQNGSRPYFRLCLLIILQNTLRNLL
jgi:hypothetical protein